MATIEKPKHKKKKTRPRDDVLETPRSSSSKENMISLEFPSTITKCDEILTHECFVSSEFQQPKLEPPKEGEESEQAIENEKSIHFSPETVEELQQLPSAPEFEEVLAAAATAPTLNLQSHTSVSAATTSLSRVSYPKLNMMRDIEYNSPALSVQELQKMQPFTDIQMKEIYQCKQIHMVKQFEAEFLINATAEHHQHPLFHHITEYAKLRSKLKVNLQDLQRYRQEIETNEPLIWKMLEKTLNFSGKCSDQLMVTVAATHKFAVIDDKVLETVGMHLSQVYELVCYSYSSNLVLAEALKMKIEQIIREIVSYSAFDVITNNTPVALNEKHDPTKIVCVNHLRIAITILFSFLRKPAPDKIFIGDVRKWLEKLVALQLRIATWEDHMFLLFNVLRCPSGISSWATPLIQVPHQHMTSGSFLSHELNHNVAYLSILLMPIAKRNEFLTAFAKEHKEISDPVREDLWILVDSDGEEGNNSSGDCTGLKERDLISLLDQISFETIFRCILSIEVDGQHFLLTDISGKQLLKILVFNTQLIDILGQGLATYNMERYRQFAKRLGRLIRHSVQYMADMLDLYFKNNSLKDPFLCERVRIEFDAFILKAGSYIYKARNLGTWQYFASFPFASLSRKAIWVFLYYFCTGFPERIINSDDDFRKILIQDSFWLDFNLAKAETSPDDLYYLLQALVSVALERNRTEDWDLIRCICCLIFKIGFINTPTVEICYKTARDMLVNLTQEHSDLISDLLSLIDIDVKEKENFIYLFKSLPLDKWRPSAENFETLSLWLMNSSINTAESVLSRYILGHLNWDWDEHFELFLPYESHARTACTICEAVNKHVPEVVGFSGISESVRQVSSFVDSQLSAKEQFTGWCWNMIFALRLHMMDQSKYVVKRSLQNPAECLGRVPEMERIATVFQGVTETRPLAIFLSLTMSLWGHSIPLICQKGFSQMQLLLNDHRHSATIRCLHLTTPLFLECPETLSKCECFQNILKQILDADRTYVKMAKELITSNSPGPVLEIFGNMIQAQIIGYAKYGLTTPTMIINLWLQCFTHPQIWHKQGVYYLVDLILKIAFQYSDSWKMCEEYLRQLYRSNDLRLVKPTGFKIFWTSPGSTSPIPQPTGDAVWLSFLSLQLEHEINERDNRFWSELLRGMGTSNSGKVNLDTVVKKTTSLLGIANISAYSLVVYKYASLITMTQVDHPLLPLVCQQFFSLFLARIPFSEDEERFQTEFGVADKFYEWNISLMKKLKSRLKQAEEYYLKTKSKYKGVENDGTSHCLLNNAILFKTFLLWLEETTINKYSINHHIDLPPQFNSEKLALIFSQSKECWTEFLHLPSIRKIQKQAASSYLKSCCRLVNLQHKPISSLLMNACNSKERIITHLKSYDKPIKAPDFIRVKPLCCPISIDEIDSQTLVLLKKNFESIKKFARNCVFHAKEISSLNANYKDDIKSLYRNIPYSSVKYESCRSIFSKTAWQCSGPAEIRVELKEPHKDQKIQRKIEQNREKYDKLIEKQISHSMEDMVTAMENLEHVIRYLHVFQSDNRDKKRELKEIVNVAIQFFFFLIDNLDENLLGLPSTNHLCTNVLQQLGIFIRDYQEQYGLKILEIALKRPELVKEISEFFVPSRTKPEYFISLYKFLIDSHMRRCDTKILFVLYSKFDLSNWMQAVKPKLMEISQLIKLCVTGLENWNQPESSLIQGVLRRHLVQMFEHQFPEHYGEILQKVLSSCSEQKLMPDVLLDLLNSLLLRSCCDILTLESSAGKVNEEILKFANQQNLFNFKSITDTIMLFAHHFQNERLQHGLHGLYPKHKDYCSTLSIMFTCFGHAAVVSAVHTYPGVLADQICDWLFTPINEMFSPWLIVYSGQNLQKSTANWIRQLIANGKTLHPWSELHSETAQKMLFSFVYCLQYILQTLPVSNSILAYVLGWYEYHFAKKDIGQHILVPVHNALILLPWNRLMPSPANIESFYKILHEFLPECHSFLGFIFIQVNWSEWYNEIFQNWNYSIQTRTLTLLLNNFVQISFEPHIHDNIITRKILENSLIFSWQSIDYNGIETVLNWFVNSVEPSIILKVPSESNPVDIAVLELLKNVCGMLIIERDPQNLSISSHQIQSKRILYVRSIVRMLRSCGLKNQKLLNTKEGSQALKDSLVELINLIANISNVRGTKDVELETRNMMIEIIGSLQSQGENISQLFVNAIIIWQSKCEIGSPVLCNTLNAFGTCKTFTNSMYSLLEATIYNYFKSYDNTNNHPTWELLLQRLGNCVEKLNLLKLIDNVQLLTLHAFILFKLRNFKEIGQKITFLQDLSQLLENVKTNHQTESKMAIIWGTIIAMGCNILQKTENAKKPLLMLARYLQTISVQAEGWGEGLLGVIGLKKDSPSNRRKILTRCLSCIIFKLFAYGRNSEPQPNQEYIISLEDLKNFSINKKYADVKDSALKAIDLIEKNDESYSIINKIDEIIKLFYVENFLANLVELWRVS